MFNKHKIEYYLFLGIGNFLIIIGRISAPLPAKFLAFFAYKIFGIRKKIVESNLQKAFPKKNRNEIKSLAFKNYESIATTFLEILKINKMTPEQIKNNFSDHGFDLIFDTYSQKKGLILLTAHFGNWEMGAIATNLYVGESISVLVKKQKNIFVAKWLTNFRQRFGNLEITLGTSVKSLYKAVKSKKIIGIVGDQRGTRDGVKVKFFDQDTYTFPGTAVIAMRIGCPVIVMLCSRQPDGTYRTVLKEIQHSTFKGTEDAKIQQFNQEYMNILENGIREYPDQWFWMHNIWKYNK